MTQAIVEQTPLVVVPPSDMHRHFGDLLSIKEGADVKFRVRRTTFHAHRLVLAARSPVLNKGLLGPMKALFVWPLPGRECGPIHRDTPPGGSMLPPQKVVVLLTPSYDPIPAQTHSWLVLRPGNETSPPESCGTDPARRLGVIFTRGEARGCAGGRQAAAAERIRRRRTGGRHLWRPLPAETLPKAFPPAVISSWQRRWIISSHTAGQRRTAGASFSPE
jgi:hypothetical protein